MGKGRGLGIAAHRSFLTYVATVVEVEVDGRGQVHIPNVWTAVDAGTTVSPDTSEPVRGSGSLWHESGAVQRNYSDERGDRPEQFPIIRSRA